MASSFKLSSEEDTLSKFRDEFVIPTFRSMKAAAVPDTLREWLYRASLLAIELDFRGRDMHIPVW